ncbi:putative N-acetyltransferase [Dyadobacter sp. CECT 9275]|uniref:N-acetyltransferase n=1 Tax=Dyadobacter helix TaxID=2822344 RepID=A0A916JHM2_9BACT|nr:GNAT family N-acetyltransferase [Dyadobacter sp. CECT 9275]CAG5016285.1 putative N-acetyltransferase [Dyadobacter sp. CECT 9275]
MTSFAIKHATSLDIPLIISIQERTWQPTYGEILNPEQISYMFDKIYSTQALEQQMDEGQRFFILTSSGEPLGFAAVKDEGDLVFKLHKIYVLPSAQGSGAGRHLLDEAETYVRSTGGQKLVLNVNRYNKARSFYEKMGYKVIREEDIPIGPYWMNDYVLEKELC